MPTRWLFQPVITVAPVDESGVPTGGFYRAPKHVTYGKQFNHSSVIEDKNYCISFVSAPSFALIDADAEIISLTDDDTPLDLTPQDLGWTNAKLKSKADGIKAKDAALKVTKFRLNSKFFEMIVELGGQIRPSFTDTEGTWVG